jgi:Na+/serine symporter
MTKQQSIGAWVRGLGHILLIAVFVFCMVDISGLAERGRLLMPLVGYLTGIFSGVAMQFVGAAIPNMEFTSTNPKPAK